MKILVSIINWNGNVATNACLRSIGLLAPGKQPDVFLIDNASKQQPLSLDDDVVSSLRALNITKNPQNLGFAAAHNQSLSHALANDYDYAILLNNDTELIDMSLFDELTEALSEDTKALAAAPTILGQKEPPLTWYAGGKLSTILASTQHFGVGQPPSANSQTLSVSFLTGCCLAIHVPRLREFNTLLPEQYFLYWEDADWCAQAHKAGYSLLYVPGTTILHAVSSSLGVRSPTYVYYNIRNNILFLRRHTPFIFKPLAYLRVLYVSAKYLVRGRLGAVVSGWLDGVRGRGGPKL